MIFSISSRKARANIVALATASIALFAAMGSNAQEEAPEQLFDDSILNLLLESRLQKPASQATPAERASAYDELTSIYLISDLPRAKELGEESNVRAQIELQERALIFNAFVTDFLANVNPTDEEIQHVYEEQVALAPPKEFKARHILVETQAAAIGLVDELKNGADFAGLAAAHSTGPSASSGGDLGWFTAQAMVQPFSEAVAKLDDGAFTQEPVQTQFGWHVILREDSRDSTPPPLDSVRDVIVQRIGQQKFQEFLGSLSPASAN